MTVLFILISIAATISILALIAALVFERRIIRNISAFSTGAFGFILLALIGVFAYRSVSLQNLGPKPPSLEELKTSFVTRRPALEAMKQVSDEDPDLMSIEADMVRRPSSAVPGNDLFAYEDPASQVSTSQRDQYRKLLEPLGPHAGIERSPMGDVSIDIYNGPWGKSYYLVGYTYCTPRPTPPHWNGPEGRAKPCGPGIHLDGVLPGRQNATKSSFQTVELGSGWYAFEGVLRFAA